MNKYIQQVYQSIYYSFSNKKQAIITIPILIGIIIACILLLFFPKPIAGQTFKVILIIIMLFFWGIPGLVYIIRRESPGFIIFTRGWPVVVNGLIIIIGTWGLAIYIILRFFFPSVLNLPLLN
ncbi:MAG: hypothetical protein M1281_16375 [Chloroflexi bacterium]|nr:hypothetical protein [Chloroflexota bacterium]